MLQILKAQPSPDRRSNRKENPKIALYFAVSSQQLISFVLSWFNHILQNKLFNKKKIETTEHNVQNETNPPFSSLAAFIGPL